MLYNINQTAKLLCVSQSTLRRWEKEGKIMSEKTSGGHRRYDIDKITFVKQNVNENRITIAYARVSTYDQKNDLNRQKEVLSLFCASKGYVYKIIEDLGSGLNYNKKGFKELVEMICRKQVDRIINGQPLSDEVLDKIAKEISDAIRADERQRILAEVDKAALTPIRIWEIQQANCYWEYAEKGEAVAAAQLENIKKQVMK
jgi:predicted site-specific integrase-resolvase